MARRKKTIADPYEALLPLMSMLIVGALVAMLAL